MRLAFWRTLFSVAVDAHDLFPRLVPPLVVQWAEDKFYDAGMRQTLRRATSDYREATADTIQTPSCDWSCLAGDLADHNAGTIDDADLDARDLHGDVAYPSSRQRKVWVA